jgi:uncharacterized membrane protein (DUF373 family)
LAWARQYSIANLALDLKANEKEEYGHGPVVDPVIATAVSRAGRTEMMDLDRVKKHWQNLDYYGYFEQSILRVLLIFLTLVTLYMVVLVAVQLFEDFQLGSAFMDKAVLQDVFGSILAVLIVLEFNHSVAVAIRQKTGAIQVRIIIFIAILVITRKLMVVDFSSVTVQTLLGFSALLLALGALYWLINNTERRQNPANPSGDSPAS